MHARTRSSRRRGFTLIELLVVISIIALLIGILLPSLTSARRVAWTAMGTANQRGIMQATAVYASDYSDSLVTPFSIAVKQNASNYGSNGTFINDGGGTVDNSGRLLVGWARFYADWLLEGNYVSTGAIFSDPGKPTMYSMDSINWLALPPTGAPGFRCINPTTGATLFPAESITTAYGLSYLPSTIFYSGSAGFTGVPDPTTYSFPYGYYDAGGVLDGNGAPTSLAGWSDSDTKFMKFSNRPHPSDNMWLTDSNEGNDYLCADQNGASNMPPYRNGNAQIAAGTSAAVFFDGHAAVFQNGDIYGTYAPNGYPGMPDPVTGSYWPDASSGAPTFVGARFWDIRNTIPLGSNSALSIIFLGPNPSAIDQANIDSGLIDQ